MISNQPQRRLLASAVFAALVSLVHAPPLLAQDTAAATDDVEAEPTRLDGLTVTAQKRDEQLQDVPIAVTALSQELLQDTGVRDVKDL